MRALRWLGWILGGFLLLVVAGFLVLRFLVPVDTLRREAVERAEAATGYDIELDELELGLSLSGLSLRTGVITIANPALDEADGARFLSLERVEVGVALAPLLRKQVEVTRLVLVRPSVDLRRTSDGRLNAQVSMGDKAAAGEEPSAAEETRATEPAGAGSAGVLLAVPEASIVDASLRYVDAEAGTQLAIDDLDGQLQVGLESQIINLAGKIAIERLAIEPPTPAGAEPLTYGPLDLELTFDLAYAPDAASLSIRRCDLALAAIELAVTGAVESLDGEPRLSLDLRSEPFEPARLLSLVPDGVPPELRLEGKARIDATVRGPLATAAIAGTLRLDGLAVQPPGFDRMLLTELDGELEFTRDTATVQSLRGRMPGGTFALRAAIEEFAAPRLESEIEFDADVRELASLATLPPEMSVRAGRARGKVRCKTQAPDFAGNLTLGGTIDLTGVDTQLPGVVPAVMIESCPIRLDGQAVTISPLSVRAGRSDLKGEISARNLAAPVVGFQLAANRLDLDELLPAAVTDAGATSAGPGRDRATGEAAGDGAPSAGGIPPLPQTSGRVAAREVVYRGMTASNLKLRVEIDAEGLHIEDVTGRLLGGALAGDLHVVPTTADSLRYTSTLEVKGVQANEILTATTPIKNLVHGTLDANLDIGGLTAPDTNPLTLLSANGNSAVTAGYLRVAGPVGDILRQIGVVDSDRLPFDELVSKLVVKNGRVQLDNGKMMSGSHGDYHIGGSVGFDGSLAIDIEGLIPATYLPREVASNPQLVKLLSDDQGRVPLGFRVGGDLRSPRVQVQMDELQRQFQARLAAEASDKVKSEAQKAVDGLLKGLLNKDKK